MQITRAIHLEPYTLQHEDYDLGKSLHFSEGICMVSNEFNFIAPKLDHTFATELACSRRELEIVQVIISNTSLVALVAVGLLLGLFFVFHRCKRQKNVVKELGLETYPKHVSLDGIDSVDKIGQYESIDHKSFMALEKLGDGVFGEVFKGALFHKGKLVLCAIKCLKEEHIGNCVEKLLTEAEVMKGLRHKNVVRIFGVSGLNKVERSQICILMEYLPGGDLKKYLQTSTHIALAERLWFCLQLAQGCEYIAQKKLVHRDIAARNCLLGSIRKERYPIVKIGDFGLARVLEENSQCEMETDGLMPIRWMAVESILNRHFSEASDVWAFGITAWEIFSNGSTPYEDVETCNLSENIVAGLSPNCPENCPTEVFEIIRSCWSSHPQERPSSSELAFKLKGILQRVQNTAATRATHVSTPICSETEDMYQKEIEGLDTTNYDTNILNEKSEMRLVKKHEKWYTTIDSISTVEHHYGNTRAVQPIQRNRVSDDATVNDYDNMPPDSLATYVDN
eukprot:CFRG7244T1